MTSIEVVDPLTVAFRLSQRNTTMLDALASPFNCVYSAKKLAADPVYPTTTPMGTGAFTFTTQVRGERIEGKRFDGYFREGRPYLDGYRVVSVSAPSYENTFIAGQVDGALAGMQPAKILNALNSLGNKFKTMSTVIGTVTFLSFNHERKPFDDVRVRRALTLAVDRRTGIEALRRITNFVEYGGVLRPNSPMAQPDSELAKLPGYGADVAAALGIFAISQFKEIGVAVEQDNLEAPIYIDRLTKRDFEVTYEGDGGASSDPAFLLVKFLPGSPSNYAKIADPMLTDLFNRQKGELDRGQRTQIIQSFERRLLSEAYLMPMFWGGLTVGVRDYVNGWYATPNFWLGYDLVNVWRSQ